MEFKKLLSKIAYYLEVEHVPGSTQLERYLRSSDLLPVEPARRQWHFKNFVFFWLAECININTWMVASTMIQGGLSWWEAWVCVWIGFIIAASFLVLAAHIGATYHIGFPVIVRAPFGIFGALWPVLNRTVMACIWYGVQAWIGGECVTLMIRAIWPSYVNMKNTMGSSGTTTYAWVSFFIFWLCSLPALWFPVHKIRHLFTVKSVIVPIAAILFFVWAVVKAHGLGPIVNQSGTLHGSDHVWAWIKGIMSCICSFCTLILNNADFSRFASSPKTAVLSQLVTIPLGFGVTCFIGLIVGSASQTIYGKSLWDPLELLSEFLYHTHSHAVRTGVFFLAFSFAFAQLGVNVSANSVSAGSDMTALFPRFINIRRGSYVCAIVGIAMCPWKLLSSGSKFTTVLSAYSVFLSSFCGTISADYFIVRKGYYSLPDLFEGKNSAYWYHFGVSWRGFLAYLLGVGINIVGFVGAVGATVPETATHIYDLSFFGGFIVSFVAYIIICTIAPIKPVGDKYLTEPVSEIEAYISDLSHVFPRSSVDDDASSSQGTTPSLKKESDVGMEIKSL
ncbi:uracil permease [Schizosaccharomyces japonicus yFS275]|uniref:Uracil permease n=1 Tax=Schizosaccharomyces japonicus (strain yFS275 / FY16936) TaxID=402676 RepID=B6K1N6_SCHJY|nr:uracil permease [Schizosaccharomyces japonicus yFS275]EEB07067.2 uracil permease [Schizosaccharomyces japonicus yFS275]